MTTSPSWGNPGSRSPYHMLIVGSGPAGLLAAKVAVRHGARVALIERNLLGGTCLNKGCIPSKTLIRTSRLYREMRDAERFGGKVPGAIVVDFPAVMQRVQRIRARLAEADSEERLTAMGIDVYFGAARFAGPRSVTVGAKVLHFEKALVATGALPVRPPIPGLEEAGYLTYENVFDVTECPKRLLVIGGGPVGCELAQAFARLGSRVTLVQDEPMFLGHEERDAAQLLSDSLARDGIEIHLDTRTSSVRIEGNDKVADSSATTRSAPLRSIRSSSAWARPPTFMVWSSRPRASSTTASSASRSTIFCGRPTLAFSQPATSVRRTNSRTSRALRGASSWRMHCFLVGSALARKPFRGARSRTPKLRTWACT